MNHATTRTVANAQATAKDGGEMVNDYGEEELYGPNHLIEMKDDDYLIQGDIEDEILMMRTFDELLECERDKIQSVLTQNYDE